METHSHSGSLTLRLPHAETRAPRDLLASSFSSLRPTHTQTHSHPDPLMLSPTDTQTYSHSDSLILRLTRTQTPSHSESLALRLTD
eukprot:4546257-Pyramimonas_sp.AAC.1